MSEKKDWNLVAKIEQKIKERYGEEAVKSPAQDWTDEQEEQHLEKLRQSALEKRANEDKKEKVEVAEGESLEDIKAKLKPKKSAISADMLDTANTYDDKVAIIRMIVGDEAGRVSSVFRNMMKQNAKSEEES